MIRDTTAQRIASDWHGGQTSALYALSSTGAILGQEDDEWYYNDAVREIRREYPDCSLAERYELSRLEDYCNYHGPRGPQPYWYENVIRRQK